MGAQLHALAVVLVWGRLFSFVGACLRTCGRFCTCVFVFEQTRVSEVVGMDVLWSWRTMVVVVVVVWSSWTCLGWGHRGCTLIRVVVVVASVDGVVVVVVMEDHGGGGGVVIVDAC